MERKRYVCCLCGDAILFLFTAFGVSATLAGWLFMMDLGRLTEAPFLFTFTGLSNLFMGMVGLICFITRLIQKEAKLPHWVFAMKMCSTALISITFLITAAYLAPSVGGEWWRLYINASLFNHLLTPVVAIVSFLFFEPKSGLPYRVCFLSLIPMACYGAFYLIRAYTHVDASGRIGLAYDVYGLARWGLGATIGFFLGFLALALGLTSLLYLQNSRKKG